MDTPKEPTTLTDPLMSLMRNEAEEATQLPVVQHTALSLLEQEALSFEATGRQVIFQEMAIEMDEKGLGYVRDWLRGSRSSDVFAGPQVSMKEWREWSKQSGFVSWFYDGFPLPREMSKEDIDGLDVVFWDTLREMMRDGDAKALDLYSKITGKVGAKDEGDRKTAVVEWLQVNTGAIAWRGGK